MVNDLNSKENTKMDQENNPIAYVLNLPKCTLRKKMMQEWLDRLDIKHQFIEAVDGKEWSERNGHKKVFSSLVNKNLSPGEIGCFLSHKKAWKIIAEGDSPFALVLEDDTVFSSKVCQVLQDLMEMQVRGIKLDFDVIRLESPELHEGKITTSAVTKTVLGGVDFYRLYSDAILAGALIISKEGARKMLSLMGEETVEPVDEILFGKSSKVRKGLIIYQSLEILAWQVGRLDKNFCSSIPSTIEEERSKGHPEPTVIRLAKKYLFMYERYCVPQRLVLKTGQSEQEKKILADFVSNFVE